MGLNLKIEYFDLNLSSDRPLELMGATLGVGLTLKLATSIMASYPAAVVLPITLLAIGSAVKYYPTAESGTELFLASIIHVGEGAMGVFVLGAKAGSYLDDVYNHSSTFMVDHKIVETIQFAYDSVYNSSMDCLQMFRDTAASYYNAKTEPENLLNGDTWYGSMRADILATYNEWREVLFGTE